MPYVVGAMAACRIVDTSAKLTAGIVGPLVDAGYQGVVRYVHLPGVQGTWDIDPVELKALLDGGLGLMLVQHVRYPGWDPAKCSGAEDAGTAIASAKAAGYLAGAHIFVDLEGISGTGDATTQYATDWAAAVVAAGYKAGCYVGYSVPLTPAQLYALENINSYWSDAGPRSVATRGFAIKQHAEIHLGGIPFDPDDVAPDVLGDTPVWMIAQ
jgi:hypothetical protein